MLSQQVDFDPIFKELRQLIKGCVVKKSYEAKKYETVESRRLADEYIAMKEGTFDWNTFASFDEDVLESAGLSRSIVKLVLSGRKEAIPTEFRRLVMQLQRDKIINGYIETNTYYRELAGLPGLDVNRSDYVYMYENDDGIPTNIPIHELDDKYFEYINSTKYREDLLARHPDAKYLEHLGSHSIDFYRSRTALNYEIIYLDNCENDNLTSAFMKSYIAARNYVMIGLYNKADENTYNEYDNFMGLSIMVIAIQKTLSSVFEDGITRNFYDDRLIRYLYEAYNITFIPSIDIIFQRRIAKKLNIMLQKKSSNAVFFDITSIFGYNANIYQYYLMKNIRLNTKGQPLIFYKTIYDEENKPHRVLDDEKTYDIYFQKVNINSRDKLAEINDISNRIEYNEITGDDPYWVEDSNLVDKIYDSNYNYTLTKYLSIDISYELAKLMYESSYCIRMILEDQEDFKKIYVKLPWVDEPANLFDTTLLLCALSAKKFGLAGNVPLKPYQIAQVYGFNFKTDIDKLKADILADIDICQGEYRSVRLELLEKLKTLHCESIEGAEEMFENINELRKWLDTAMRYSNSIEEYEAYRKIYNAVLLTHDIEELYTKSDGTYATTFRDLLNDRRPDLVVVLDESTRLHDSDFEEGDSPTNLYTSRFSINNKINKILEILSTISPQLREFRYMNDKEAIVLNIEKLINQFKSYTVNDAMGNILYLVDDPHICLLKIIDYIYDSKVWTVMSDQLKWIYYDVLDSIVPRRTWNDKIAMNDLQGNMKKSILVIYEILTMWDKYRTIKTNDASSNIPLYDLLHEFLAKYMRSVPLKITDRLDKSDLSNIWWLMIELIIREKVQSNKNVSKLDREYLFDALHSFLTKRNIDVKDYQINEILDDAFKIHYEYIAFKYIDTLSSNKKSLVNNTNIATDALHTIYLKKSGSDSLIFKDKGVHDYLTKKYIDLFLNLKNRITSPHKWYMMPKIYLYILRWIHTNKKIDMYHSMIISDLLYDAIKKYYINDRIMSDRLLNKLLNDVFTEINLTDTIDGNIITRRFKYSLILENNIIPHLSRKYNTHINFRETLIKHYHDKTEYLTVQYTNDNKNYRNAKIKDDNDELSDIKVEDSRWD